MAYHYLWPEVEMLQHILVSWLVLTVVTSILRHIVFLPGRAWNTL